MEASARGLAVAEELSKYWIKLHKKHSNCCCTVFSSHSSRSMCQRVCLLLALERERGETDKSWPSPAGGWVLFSQMREGGVGEIVFLSPPLLFCHICCFLGTGLGVAELSRARAPISSFTQNQASLTGDGARLSPEERETKWVSCCRSAMLCRRGDDDRTQPQLRAEQVSKQVSEGKRKMCAGECVRNRVRSSAESGLFCVSQSVTSKLGAGRWGEGHLLTTSLSLPHSTVGSLLILPVSAPVSLFLYQFLSFFVLPSFPFLHLFFISNLSYNNHSINWRGEPQKINQQLFRQLINLSYLTKAYIYKAFPIWGFATFLIFVYYKSCLPERFFKLQAFFRCSINGLNFVKIETFIFFTCALCVYRGWAHHAFSLLISFCV